MFDLLVYAWILGSLGIAVYANSRGRPPVPWLLVSLFLSPVIALVLLLVLPDAAVEAQRHDELVDALRDRE